MERMLEPEVMDELDQVCAYASANFERENQGFVDQFITYFPDMSDGHILDVGCGPADIPIRLARALRLCRITGVDASQPMIDVGNQAVKNAGLADRITLHCERLQSFFLAEPCDGLRVPGEGEVRRRVERESHRAEQDERRHEQDRHGVEDPPDDEGDHVLPPWPNPAAAWVARDRTTHRSGRLHRSWGRRDAPRATA